MDFRDEKELNACKVMHKMMHDLMHLVPRRDLIMHYRTKQRLSVFHFSIPTKVI